ncbi:arsenate reductase [Klebsiella pneumoniae subsp. pneumoniae]|nr:arsenate reductase [Klebsiella pneumoniae subsp. pneumoniae]
MSCASCSPRWGSRCARCRGKRRTLRRARGPAEDRFTDDQIIDSLCFQHPILINRPDRNDAAGARLCRPVRGGAGDPDGAAKGAFQVRSDW